ncbi:MAG: OsmC family protein [Acidimicrobiales bacterium]
MTTTLRFHASLSWQGSTGAGYDVYNRTHRAVAPPAEAELSLSADAAFHGVEALLDPEQLVVMAASSCQLLSFLAVAARARIDVVAYEDDAEAIMPWEEGREYLTRIVLRPRITVVRSQTDGPTPERVRALVAVAHRECYVANSLRSDVDVEPEILFVAAAPP